MGTYLYVGSSEGASQQADAVMDELRISDAPRLGPGFVWAPYAFVADSGHHQIHAIGRWLDVLDSFGAFGSGPGQFSSPEAVALTPDGSVIVADTGNDRLQVLAFEDGQFSYSQTITASLDRPRGVAARFGYTVVAW